VIANDPYNSDTRSTVCTAPRAARRCLEAADVQGTADRPALQGPSNPQAFSSAGEKGLLALALNTGD